MDTRTTVLAALIGYLLGSISFARLVTRFAAPEANVDELRVQIAGTEESEPVGIAGGNAASMILGPKLGLTVAMLDMLKVLLPMFVFRGLYPEQPYHLVVATAGLIGHNWPIYYRFRGGRGFAVIFGSFLLLDWVGTLVSLLLGLTFGITILGNPMIAYISWLWLIVPWFLWQGTSAEVIYALLVNLLFILAVIPEIRTLLRLRKEGKYRAYMHGLYNSSPRWRGMKKMTDRLWVFRFFLRQREEKF